MRNTGFCKTVPIHDPMREIEIAEEDRDPETTLRKEHDEPTD